MSQIIIYGLLLALGAFLAGLAALRVTAGRQILSFFLVFTGGYLFSITIIHLLPEIYQSDLSPFRIGLMVLIGFFIQQLLEFFTAGVEHGHIHSKEGHSHGKLYGPSVVIALCTHSLLEGGILTQTSMQPIVLGILLHKIPAAFALVTILRHYSGKSAGILTYLIIFSLASPLGMFLGIYLPEGFELYLMALVAGNFLQISTTIVFENTADHKFNIRKIIYSLLGAVLAILSEVLFF